MLNMKSTFYSQTNSNCYRFIQIHPTSNLKDLFKNTKQEEILSFLKETNPFIKI